MPHTCALLVIDMQNAMMQIAHRPGRLTAVIAGLRARAEAAGVPIVTIQDSGGELTPGSPGWQIVPELTPGEDEPLIHKTTADAFLDTELAEVLCERGITELVITGFATENCVETTARQALSRGYDLVLVADGHTTSVRPTVSDFAPAAQAIAHHNEIYRHLAFPQRNIRVIPASEVDFSAPRP